MRLRYKRAGTLEEVRLVVKEGRAILQHSEGQEVLPPADQKDWLIQMACKRELEDLYEHGFADLAADFEGNTGVFLD